MRAPTRRDDPAWAAMFARLDAAAKARRRAEAQRWRGLSDAEKWAEMASAVRRWRHLTDEGVRNQLACAIALDVRQDADV